MITFELRRSSEYLKRKAIETGQDVPGIIYVALEPAQFEKGIREKLLRESIQTGCYRSEIRTIRGHCLYSDQEQPEATDVVNAILDAESEWQKQQDKEQQQREAHNRYLQEQKAKEEEKEKAIQLVQPKIDRLETTLHQLWKVCSKIDPKVLQDAIDELTKEEHQKTAANIKEEIYNACPSEFDEVWKCS